MCLIAYVRAGSQIPEEYFRSAAYDNDDGIGIMSQYGVEKFLGRKMVKRAWRQTRRLHDDGIAFAVHFRFATHGIVALRNTHPFKTPDGNAYVMHNGILSQYTPKDRYGDTSDTRNLVDVMIGVDVAGDNEYWKKLADHIGYSNKLCVMDASSGVFRIVNESAGDWIAGVWYSQTYSLPGYGWSDQVGAGMGAVSNYSTGGYVAGYGGRSWYFDRNGKYHERGDADYKESDAEDTNTNLIPYDKKALIAAYNRRYGVGQDGDWRQRHADDCNCKECVAEAYDSIARGHAEHAQRDDAALDAELEKHFADINREPTDICPSCECLHNDGPHCPECGYTDPEGMLPGAVRIG